MVGLSPGVFHAALRQPLLVRKGEFQAPRTSALPLEDIQDSTDRF